MELGDSKITGDILTLTRYTRLNSLLILKSSGFLAKNIISRTSGRGVAVRFLLIGPKFEWNSITKFNNIAHPIIINNFLPDIAAKLQTTPNGN